MIDKQSVGLIFSALAGLWIVAKLILGSYIKQKERIAQLEKSKLDSALAALRLTTSDHTKEIRLLSTHLTSVDKNLIKATERLIRFEEKMDDYQKQETEMIQLLSTLIRFIQGSSDQSEVIQLGNAYLVRKATKKE